MSWLLPRGSGGAPPGVASSSCRMRSGWKDHAITTIGKCLCHAAAIKKPCLIMPRHGYRITIGRSSLGIRCLSRLTGQERCNRDDTGRRLIPRKAFDGRNRATHAYVDNDLINVEGHLMETVMRRSEAINQAQIRRLPGGSGGGDPRRGDAGGRGGQAAGGRADGAAAGDRRAGAGASVRHDGGRAVRADTH